MIKINWFDDSIKDKDGKIIREKYAEKISAKIIKHIKREKTTESFNEKNYFPPDIAVLFVDNGSLSENKIQDFLKMSFNQVLEKEALKNYIDRRFLLLRCLKNVNKKDYDKWSENTKKNSITDYLNEKFKEYKQKYPDYSLEYFKDQKTPEWKNDFKSVLSENVLYESYNDFFDYKKVDDKLRHELMSALNIPVCPFCNRQYITSWDYIEDEEEEVKVKSTADLDHFFPKIDYPLFALSLFNFVPSCQVCNSRMKLDNFMDDDGNRPIYPYDESFDDTVVFKPSVLAAGEKAKKLLEVWLGENTEDLKIELDYGQKDNESELTDYQKHVKRSIELYHLKEVYQAHKMYVSELMLKRRIYDDGEYLKGLQRIFQKSDTDDIDETSTYRLIDTDIIITKKQLEAFLYGYNWEDGQDKTRPLSKLAYDILKR